MLHLILLNIFIHLDARIDLYLLRHGKHEQIHTFLQYSLRAVVFVLLTVICRSSWQQGAVSLLVYWFVFDSTIAKLLGKPIAYLSEKGIDKFQRPMVAWWFWKMILAFAAAAYMINPGWYSV